MVASGGHPLPLRVAADGTVSVRSAGPAPCSASSTGRGCTPPTADLAAGDVVLLYTDGVTEARRHGEFFGEERLAALLVGQRGGDATAIAERIADEVVAFQDGLPRDDIALVVLRVPAREDRLSGRWPARPGPAGRHPVVPAGRRQPARRTSAGPVAISKAYQRHPDSSSSRTTAGLGSRRTRVACRFASRRRTAASVVSDVRVHERRPGQVDLDPGRAAAHHRVEHRPQQRRRRDVHLAADLHELGRPGPAGVDDEVRRGGSGGGHRGSASSTALSLT